MELQALIESRPTRRDQAKVWYGQLLEAADRSGVSVAELASRLGCSRETVYAWRRRLNKRPAANGGSPTPKLVRVRVAQAPTDAPERRVEVRLPSGRSLLVPDAFDAATLAAVVEVLERC